MEKGQLATVFNRLKEKNEGQIVHWQVLYRISGMNFISARHLFAPDLDYWVIFDEQKEKFIIKKNNQFYFQIPDDLILRVIGNSKGKNSLKLLAKRIKFDKRKFFLHFPWLDVTDKCKLQLRFLTQNNLDLMYAIPSRKNGKWRLLSSVKKLNSLDQENCQKPNNLICDKGHLNENQTFLRICRKS